MRDGVRDGAGVGGGGRDGAGEGGPLHRQQRTPGAWASLLALVLPVACPACGRPDVRLCRRCGAVLRAAARAPAGPVPVAAPGCPPVWSALPYAPPVQPVLLAWKDGGRSDLTRVLAPVLAAAVRAALAGQRGPRSAEQRAVWLVPVPSAPSAVRRRGRDAVADLARAAARAAPPSLGPSSPALPLRLAPVLRQVRGVRDQAGLGAASRAHNLAGALRVRTVPVPALAGRPCLLVDDVVTTGASLAEGARALRAAGAVVVGAATVAATPRRLGAPGGDGSPGAPPRPADGA